VRLRILLADDHVLIRKGLRALLEREGPFEVCGEASDGREAVRLAEELKPQVAVLDVGMPHLNGIEAARLICDLKQGTAVVMLSMHSDEAYVLRALRAGARGYLLKDSAEADLASAVAEVARGRSYFSPAVSRVLLEDYVRKVNKQGGEDRFELLSGREREVLQLVAEGNSTKEIAAVLGVSTHTVDTHRANVIEKLGLKGTAELILFAVRRGVIH